MAKANNIKAQMRAEDQEITTKSGYKPTKEAAKAAYDIIESLREQGVISKDYVNPHKNEA